MVGVLGFWVGVLDVTRLLFKGGIQLNGLPASFAVGSSTPICPFTLQGGRFIAATQLSRQLVLSHRHALGKRFVSVPLPALSHYAFTSVASLLRGRSFLKRLSSSRSKATRQLTSPSYHNQSRM